MPTTRAQMPHMEISQITNGYNLGNNPRENRPRWYKYALAHHLPR